MNEQIEKRNKLALDVLRLSRNTLLVNLRFLDAALNQLEPLIVEGLTLATDGEALAYDPAAVLRLYRDQAGCVISGSPCTEEQGQRSEPLSIL